MSNATERLAISKMSTFELLGYVLENPICLTDRYYKVFGDAVRARGRELKLESAISWGGFVLRGDTKSVQEAKRLLERNDRLTALEAEIAAGQLVRPT